MTNRLVIDPKLLYVLYVIVASNNNNNSNKSDGITFTVLNFWSYTPNGTRSYGRLADRRNPGDF